jgi:hypothetical protein
VIGALTIAGNAGPEMPVLFSDGPCWWVADQESKMSKTLLFGAATLASMLVGSPASAQHMIDEPGMFAFVHPNGDLGIGSPRPALDAQATAPRIVLQHPLPMHHRMKLRK